MKILQMTLILVLATLATVTSASPWLTPSQVALERTLLDAAHTPGVTLCVPVAEVVRATTGAEIIAVEGVYDEQHAIACKDGLCVDNGLLTKGPRGVRRAFLLEALDSYYKVIGTWNCKDGAGVCQVNGRGLISAR